MQFSKPAQYGVWVAVFGLVGMGAYLGAQFLASSKPSKTKPIQQAGMAPSPKLDLMVEPIPLPRSNEIILDPPVSPPIQEPTRILLNTVVAIAGVDPNLKEPEKASVLLKVEKKYFVRAYIGKPIADGAGTPVPVLKDYRVVGIFIDRVEFKHNDGMKTILWVDPPSAPVASTGDQASAEMYYQLAQSKEEMFRIDEAIQQYDQVVKLMPNSAEAYAGRARMKLKNDDYAGAARDFTKALELKPDDAELLGGRANANYLLRQYQSAFEDVNRALEANPYDANAYLTRAFIERDSMGHSEKVVADLEKSRELNPKLTAKDFDLLGRVEYKYGEFQKAIDAWSQVILLNPQHASAYGNRGWCKYKLEDFDGAISDYRTSLEINPSSSGKVQKMIEWAEARKRGESVTEDF